MRSTIRELRKTILGARRVALDLLSSERRRFVVPGARPIDERAGFRRRITLEQSAGGTTHSEAKRHNIALAALPITSIIIGPGEIFSFWRIVGRPAPGRGFVPGRSLVHGRVELDYGGGLCQLSGMLYYLALMGGLEIIERHPHTRDIYTEESRYAPLGADAAVAYGFKDLRIANPFSFPISFTIELAGDRLIGGIASPEEIVEHHVRFDREDREDGIREVMTLRAPAGSDRWEELGRSRYTFAEEH